MENLNIEIEVIKNTNHIINNRLMKTVAIFSNRPERVRENFKIIANPHHRWNLYMVSDADNSLPVKEGREKKEFANLDQVQAFIKNLSDSNKSRWAERFGIDFYYRT